MIIYFNEAFLEEEFDNTSSEDFIEALKIFNDYCTIICNKRELYSSQKIYFKTNESLKDFISIFDDDKYQDLYLLLLQNINTSLIKFWNGNQVQNEDYHYFYFDTSIMPPKSIDVKETSLAEAAETKNKGENNVFILNLPNLKYGKTNNFLINLINKQNSEDVNSISLICCYNSESIDYWIDKKISEALKYKDFSRTPNDEETCLLNKTVYRKIDGVKDGHGRQVYIDNSRRYYCVDNLHTGESAHIEVFDKNKQHIGEATLDGFIDTKKASATKSLDIN